MRSIAHMNDKCNTSIQAYSDIIAVFVKNSYKKTSPKPTLMSTIS